METETCAWQRRIFTRCVENGMTRKSIADAMGYASISSVTNKINGSQARMRETSQMRRRIMSRMKEQRGCDCCGYSKYGGALDWNHLDPEKKSFNVALYVSSNHNWDGILAEIDKCNLLCANCHREHTNGIS